MILTIRISEEEAGILEVVKGELGAGSDSVIFKHLLNISYNFEEVYGVDICYGDLLTCGIRISIWLRRIELARLFFLMDKLGTSSESLVFRHLLNFFNNF